ASWDTKGDCGSGTAWTSIGALAGVPHVYAMRNDRYVARSLAGSSNAWSAWAPAGDDTCWVSIAVSPNYVFALRADGRVDRATQDATPTWSEAYGDVGDDGAAGLDTVVSELIFILLPVIVLVVVTRAARRKGGNEGRSGGDLR
ncbi:MAG: hypothetical protein L0Z54_02170, partial [Thermoplasmata archaeon]|nr:hypothetical protein [Thermoplasmata archaeon]